MKNSNDSTKTKHFFYEEDGYDVKLHLGRIIGCVVAAIIALILVLNTFSRVPTGHTGVVTTFGKVENYVFDSGIHVKAPWKKVICMDNRVQKESVELCCFSADIQQVDMLYTINYQISKADAMTIYATIGKDYYTTVIAPTISESVKIVTAKYNAESLVEDRSAMARAIEDDLADKLAAYNIELVSTSIENMDFTDAFESAVEAKQVAYQNKLKATTEAEQKVVEAEKAAEIEKVNADAEAYKRKVSAQADAEAQKVQADADAYKKKVAAEADANATKVRGTATAQANKEIAASMTPELIEHEKIEKWSGNYPNTMMGANGATPIITID